MGDNLNSQQPPARSNDSSGPSRPDGTSSAPRAPSQEQKERRSVKPKRSVVHVACLACRRLRIKCDGDRPTCMPCIKRYETCVYDVEANTTRSNALKRKNEDLTRENAQLRELYGFLRNRPLVEAEEIFRRIRNTHNPLDVLRHVVTADLLINQGGSPASTSHLHGRENRYDFVDGDGASGGGSKDSDYARNSR